MANNPSDTRPADTVGAPPSNEQPAVAAHDAPTVVIPPTPRRRRTWIFVLIFVLIIGVSVGVWLWLRHAASHPNTDDAYIQGDTVDIAPKIAGRVIRITVHDQQTVTKGQIVARLDPVDANIAVKQGQAALQAAQARLVQAQAALVQQQHAATAQVHQARAAAAAATARQASAETTVGLQSGQVGTSIAASQAAARTAAVQVQTAQANASAAASAIQTAQAEVASNQVAANLAQADVKRYEQLYNQAFITRQQVEQARATYQTALARLRGSQASLLSAQRQRQAAVTQINVALEQVRQAQAQIQVAAANAPQIAVRRQEAQAAQAEQVEAQAGVEAARAQQGLIAVRKAELASARAAVETARTQLATAQRELEETVVYAPSDGVVSQVRGQVGQVVQPDEPLMALVIREHRWVDANFKETQLTNMQPGQPASIYVDALRRTYRGHIESIGPATGAQFALLPPENASGNFTKVVQRVPVRVVFDDPDEALQLGLSSVVTIDTTVAGTTTPAPRANAPSPNPAATASPRAGTSRR